MKEDYAYVVWNGEPYLKVADDVERIHIIQGTRYYTFTLTKED